MLVPYNCNKILFANAQALFLPHFPNPDCVRWEKHRMWVVEATLHPGNHNVNAKRRFYIDEDSWYALLGEGYDAQGNMVKGYCIFNGCIPSVPTTCEQVMAVYSFTSGDCNYNGNYGWADIQILKREQQFPASEFESQEMAAQASF